MAQLILAFIIAIFFFGYLVIDSMVNFPEVFMGLPLWMQALCVITALVTIFGSRASDA